VTGWPRWDWNISPYLARGEGWNLRWFTLFWCFELALGYWLLARQIRRGGGDDEDAADLAVHVWLGLVVGARIGEVLFYHWQLALSDPAWILRLATGGISSHGAVIGSGLAVLLYTNRRSLAFLDVTDRLAFSFGAAAIIHRVANLFNSEIVGKPTDGRWGLRLPHYDGENAPFRHPTQLYEALLGALVVCCLWAADRHWGGERRPRGIITGLALTTYFTFRILVELLKEPQANETFGGVLNMGQLLSLPLLGAGLLLTWRSLHAKPLAGWRTIS
jgi:phosphatidylglycerol---prolipoprotein diacylglyceryl transferase